MEKICTVIKSQSYNCINLHQNKFEAIYSFARKKTFIQQRLSKSDLGWKNMSQITTIPIPEFMHKQERRIPMGGTSLYLITHLVAQAQL